MNEYQGIENVGDFYDYVLWNHYDFKSLRTNKHVEGWHHRLNNVTHPYCHLFIRAIQDDYAYSLACHLATGILTPQKKSFVNRNARLHNLEEHFKQQTLTIDEYIEKIYATNWNKKV